MRTLIISVALMCLAAAPATRQVREPSQVLDSPQSVQHAYRDAINAQDAPAALALFEIRTPGERATAELFIANDLPAALLAVAAEKAFGVPLMGGGTLLPPIATDAWTVEGDLATLPTRNSPRPLVPPLRKTDGSYRIDLVAWGLDWMDDGDEVRARRAGTRMHLESVRKLVSEGFYRDLEEVRDAVHGLHEVLSARPGNVIQPKPPRAFRRPVKVDLSSPLATYRSSLLARAEGDGAALIRCFEIVDPADRAGIEAYARFVTTTADLEEAAIKKFGSAEKVGIGAPVPDPRDEALSKWSELSEADEALVVKGDEASWIELDEPLFELVRINQEWKLRSRPKSMIGQKEEEGGMDWTMIYGMIADFQEKFAREISAGKYASLEELRGAIKQATTAAAATRATG